MNFVKNRYWPYSFLLFSLLAFFLSLLPLTGAVTPIFFVKYIKVVYYIIFMGILIVFSRFIGPAWIRKNGQFLAVSFVLTGVIFLSVHPAYRVLADETNLISTSLQLAKTGHFLNGTESIYIMGKEKLLEAPMALRPGFYAFLVSILHSVLGLHHWNGFVVNFFVSWFALFVTIQLFKELSMEYVAIPGAILLASFPLYMLVLTSAQFDGLNFLLILSSIYGFVRFVNKKDSRRLFEFLFFAAIAGHGRYESVLVFLIAVVVSLAILFINKIELEIDGKLVATLFVPFLIVPLVWQRLLSGHIANPGDSDAEAIGFRFVLVNLQGAIDFFMNRSPEQMPVSRPVFSLAFMGALWFLKDLFSGSTNRTFKRYVYFTGSVVILILAVHWMFYHGNISWPWVMRLGLVYLLILVPFATYFLFSLIRWKESFRVPVIIASVVIFLSQLAIAQKNEKGLTLTLTREFEFTKDSLFSLVPNEAERKHTLVISERPGMFVALGFSAVSDKRFQQQESETRDFAKNKFFQNIFWIKNLDAGKPDEPVIPELISGSFELSTEKELSILHGSVTQIRRLKPGE